MTIRQIAMNTYDFDTFSPDRNLYEFDLNLWQLAAKIARDDASQAAELFHSQVDVMEALAKSSVSDLEMLSSGVLLSFKLLTPEDEVISMLQDKYDPLFFINGSPVQEFDSAYWMLMNSLAKEDLDSAAIAFGISKKLAEQVTNATLNQLRQLSVHLAATFEFRCPGDLIKNIIVTHVGERTPFIIKKMQMSLLASGNGIWEI